MEETVCKCKPCCAEGSLVEKILQLHKDEACELEMLVTLASAIDEVTESIGQLKEKVDKISGIPDNSVTHEKVAVGAIGSENIVDGSVLYQKISATAIDMLADKVVEKLAAKYAAMP